MDGSIAELCYHEGRIFVTTWPMILPKGGVLEAGLWMSPKLHPVDGLGRHDAWKWEKVWSVSDYEPDPVIACSYGGGALASFNGWLYWGTMNVPMAATLSHLAAYGEPENKIDYIVMLIGTWRAISIFKGKDLDARKWVPEIDLRWGKRKYPGVEKITNPRWNDEFYPHGGKRFDPRCKKVVELLYGEWFLPVFEKNKGWRLYTNKMVIEMGLLQGKPKYGHSGFGNPFNNYCWAMGVYKKELYVGTMDWSYLLFATLGLEYA